MNPPNRRWVLLLTCLLLTACVRPLQRSVRRDISVEHDKLAEARLEVQHSQDTVNRDLARNADLFRNASTPATWNASLEAASQKLTEAEHTDRQLEDILRRNRADSRPRAESLLLQERGYRESATEQSKAAETQAEKWVNFKSALPANLARMQHEYEQLHDQKSEPVATLVHKAETDWPAKRPALEKRLNDLISIPKSADQQWSSTAAARQSAAKGDLSGPALATLIEADDDLTRENAEFAADSSELRALSGQLYDSWDKILTDLDASGSEGERFYRERIKTVRTHLVDVAVKTSTTSSAEQWVTVSEPTYRAVQNDMGMAIAHKDTGLFDSEAQTTPQPAGFAYIATEQEGRNQYGYWNHEGGSSIWTWLPEYLILRELLWNHDYHPVVLNEFRGYRMAQSSGRSYYGQSTPSAPPRYGTQGTFTQTHYANSRYAQSGGFKGSAFASDRTSRGPSGFGAMHSQPQPGSFAKDSGAGKRFGFGAGSPSGKHFGSPGGFRSPGRGFGRRR